MCADLLRDHDAAFHDLLFLRFGVNHENVCTGKSPAEFASMVLIDGNEKVNRSICPGKCYIPPSGSATDVAYKTSMHSRVWQESRDLPCGDRPMKGRRVCFMHRNESRVKNPTGAGSEQSAVAKGHGPMAPTKLV